MSIQAIGSCNCGLVTFEVRAELKDVYICHCSICRKSTGSGGIAVSIVANESFNWLSGLEHIKTWRKPGHDWETSFCTCCGSSLPGKNDENSTYIPAGLFDSGHENLRVKQHLYVDSKACWEQIPEDKYCVLTR